MSEVPDELTKAAAIGSFIAQNWLPLLIALAALGGTGALFSAISDLKAGMCESEVEIATLKERAICIKALANCGCEIQEDSE
ncbi:MAG: hypothetical protein D6816_17080 [Bacteroidetes bacterium]|nr:MAG: hypothetical protein D6816_17080 [Bacteroidota bacterium]